MTDVQAALGVVQLPKLDGWIERRRELWERYDELLEDLPLDTPPRAAPDTRHARHLYQVRLTGKAPLGRDELIQGLHDRNIGTGVHYRGVHLHPYYRDSYALSAGDFPVATRLSERTVSLPLGPTLTDGDQDEVVRELRRLLAPRRRMMARSPSTAAS
jgi:dTDP-4-amino-4,6-dideoxygalactose transaminase